MAGINLAQPLLLRHRNAILLIHPFICLPELPERKKVPRYVCSSYSILILGFTGTEMYHWRYLTQIMCPLVCTDGGETQISRNADRRDYLDYKYMESETDLSV